MNRIKSFDATGVAPNGVLYAGDLNAIQDAAAALSNLSQILGIGTLQIGETGLQLIRFGAGEARLTGAFRIDGILRAGGTATGGLLPAAYTTAQRDAIPAGSRPPGMTIYNVTTNQWELNSGTDAAPAWRPMGLDTSGSLSFTGVVSALSFTNENAAANAVFLSRLGGDTAYRYSINADGRLSWGPGATTALDTVLYRSAATVLATDGRLLVSSRDVARSTATGLRRIESGSFVWNSGSSQDATGTVSFAVPFSSAPVVILTRNDTGTGGTAVVSSVTTTGFNYLLQNVGSGKSATIFYMAEGAST